MGSLSLGFNRNVIKIIRIFIIFKINIGLMEEYNISIAKMSGDVEFNENLHLVLKKYKKIPFGSLKYNNKICSDVERMITRDLEELEFTNAEKSTKKQLKKILLLTRKYPTCYFYIKEITKDIEEETEIEVKNNVPELNFRNTGGYEFWFNLNNEKIKISTYSEAMNLHLKLLKEGDYKMSEFFLQLAKKMTDNPTQLYQNSEFG